jgi:hypothetical protein
MEVVQMLITPLKEDLNDVMELGQRGVVAHQDSPPDERTNVSQDNTELINIG